ncbi:hypothetical protein C5L14_19090 [Labrys okinawensis]|uniref:Capsule biosynthesis protein n=1 Tax=Labrys okinawensis TaxID=346911 RepID=A0A2S9QAH4_9HYPH|nr:hypothetical protein C5L14_19090 [Labrys okinawensis]
MWLVFILPTLLSALYLFVFAADQFASDAQVMVRTPAENGLNAILNAQGFSRSSEETQAVYAFMRSRDMAQLLSSENGLKDVYNRPESDFLSRFPNLLQKDNFERFYEHYRSWVSVTIDESTGIVSIRSYAYRADDARNITRAVINHAEAFVNRLNTRAYADRVAYAEQIVAKAQDGVAVMEAKLTRYRNEAKLVDPTGESTSALESIAKMTTAITQLQASLEQQKTLSPENPGIAALSQKITSYRSEINKLRREVVGGTGAMSDAIAGYERLTLERTLAARTLEAATTNLIKARQEAETPHVYLVRISEPNLASTAEYPRRLIWLALIAALSFIFYAVLRFAVALVGEHRP